MIFKSELYQYIVLLLRKIEMNYDILKSFITYHFVLTSKVLTSTKKYFPIKFKY